MAAGEDLKVPKLIAKIFADVYPSSKTLGRSSKRNLAGVQQHGFSSPAPRFVPI